MKSQIYNVGEKNGSWKGDKVGYAALHEWIKRRILKPEVCPYCKVRPPYDVANKSGEYKRVVDDWIYLCRRCHMESDGRLERLINRVSRKTLEQRLCKICSTLFQPKSSRYTCCSRKCTNKLKGISKTKSIDLNKLLVYRENGLTNGECAERLNVSKSTIERRFKKIRDERVYAVVCPDCSDELFQGDKLEVENWLKSHDMDDAEWYDDDGSVECLCQQCSWLMDK